MKKLVFFLLSIALLGAEEMPVTLQLQWLHQFQFAGFYVAKEKGFYDKAGLNVTIKEYDHDVNVIEEVLLHEAAYGVGRSSLLIDRSKGKEVVALGAMFQSSPSVLIVADPDIQKPQDLRGRRIMITAGEASSASIMTMLLANKVSQGDFILQKHSFNIQDLIDGKTDAMASYLSNEPFYLNQRHIPYSILNPKDYGFDFYGDILFTSEREIKEHPERVKAFYEASRQGWIWAFEHIEESAKLIHEHYNSQNKPLQNLIYEGKVLKTLALHENLPFGVLQKAKLKEIIKVYQLSGLLDANFSMEGFIDPLNLNKKSVSIGILAKRGEHLTFERWSALKDYLNEQSDTYQFEILPLDFESLEGHVENGTIDFVITNPMYYVEMENRYGISRIATLKNTNIHSGNSSTEFGSVIFTSNKHNDIKTIEDLKGLDFGAVHPKSFGGWVMAEELLFDYDISRDDMEVTFFQTHDAVVEAVLQGKVDAGTVRTDTLERMAEEGKLDLSAITVINPMKYENFPYLVSTPLYPEWPFAKLKHTSEALSNHLLSYLLAIKADASVAKTTQSSWTIPVDYSSIHTVLKHLRLPPYKSYDFDIKDVIKKYALWFYFISALLAAAIVRSFYVKRLNHYLKYFNKNLEHQVQERTAALEAANARLKKIAQTDALTRISNRGHFMNMGQLYFNLAKRNGTPLQILSLDLDNFKRINDTYGHQAGDEVLKLFTQSIAQLLRESDLFGRIGGEEFAICLQNTSLEGAGAFAERVRAQIENTQLTYAKDQIITFTVSIGIAQLHKEEDLQELLKHSDMALYAAKESGRNRIVIYEEKQM